MENSKTKKLIGLSVALIAASAALTGCSASAGNLFRGNYAAMEMGGTGQMALVGDGEAISAYQRGLAAMAQVSKDSPDVEGAAWRFWGKELEIRKPQAQVVPMPSLPGSVK